MEIFSAAGSLRPFFCGSIPDFVPGALDIPARGAYINCRGAVGTATGNVYDCGVKEMRVQKLTLRIDWGDLDLLGHVNNVAIIRYLQAGRVVFAEKIGMPVYPGMEVGPIEVATAIQFRKQLRYPGSVTVVTGIREVKNTSVVLAHRIYDEQGDLAVEATEVIVLFDFVRQVKTPLTDALRRRIDEYCASLPDAPDLA